MVSYGKDASSRPAFDLDAMRFPGLRIGEMARMQTHAQKK